MPRDALYRTIQDVVRRHWASNDPDSLLPGKIVAAVDAVYQGQIAALEAQLDQLIRRALAEQSARIQESHDAKLPDQPLPC